LPVAGDEGVDLGTDGVEALVCGVGEAFRGGDRGREAVLELNRELRDVRPPPKPQVTGSHEVE
jgi:hypothetical protein